MFLFFCSGCKPEFPSVVLLSAQVNLSSGAQGTGTQLRRRTDEAGLRGRSKQLPKMSTRLREMNEARAETILDGT